MCEDQSPARRNLPETERPEITPAHAGLHPPRPVGLDSGSAVAGPTLAGWPRQIAWSEFRDLESLPSDESEYAQISVQLAPGRVSVVREDGHFKLGEMTFRMTVVRAQSWVVSTRKTDALLAHEQGHYDIVGLCYRDLMVDLRRLRENSRRSLLLAVRRLMSEHDQRADRLSDEYDSSGQTNHGQNQPRQRAWDRQIQDCIDSGNRLTAPP